MRNIMLALGSIAMLASASPSIAAKPCKDAKGKFIKCPGATGGGATGGVAKDKNGKCHVASGPKKGQFTKC